MQLFSLPDYAIAVAEKIILALLISQVIRNITYQITNLNLARFIPKEFGGNVGLYGIITAIYSVTQFALMIPLSKLSDHIGRKPVLLLGFGLFAIGSCLYVFTTTLWELILYRAIQGAGAFLGALMALINDHYTVDERRKPLAWNQTAVGVGFLIGSAISGFFLEWFEPRVTFLVVGVVNFLPLFFIGFMIQNAPPQARPPQISTSPFPEQLANANDAKSDLIIAPKIDVDTEAKTEMRALRKNRLFWIGIILLMIQWFCFQGIVMYMMFSLVNYYQIPDYQTGLSMLPIVISYIVALMLSEKVKTPEFLLKYLYILLAGAYFCYGFLAISNPVWGFVIITSCVGIVIGLLSPANDTFQSTQISEKIRGEAFGIYNSLGFFAGILGPIVVGVLGELGGFLAPLIFMGFLCTVGAVIALIFVPLAKNTEK